MIHSLLTRPEARLVELAKAVHDQADLTFQNDLQSILMAHGLDPMIKAEFLQTPDGLAIRIADPEPLALVPDTPAEAATA